MTQQSLKRTPLYAVHVALGGRIVPFGGWEMPVQYDSILDEARAVRSNIGLFDVSHMGRLEISGPGAGPLLDRVLSADASDLRIGNARYALVCNESGGVIDDCIVFRTGEHRFFLVPNASNTEDVVDWLSRWGADGPETRLEDNTGATGMIAVQGPGAVALLSGMASGPIGEVRPFSYVDTTIAGFECRATRTGYTGEDGFELVCPAGKAETLWSALADGGGAPCGLGARDVLRLEAGLLLHGNDMDVNYNPYEAGLGKFVRPDREGYVAGEALQKVKDQGTERRLVGFNMTGRGIARQGQPIVQEGLEIGVVTSGSYSPTLDRNIGLGYVPKGLAAPGSRILIDVRGRFIEAEITSLPFYSRRTQR